MAELFEKTIEAQIGQLPLAQEFISKRVQPIFKSKLWKIELSVEEAIANIIQHGYQGIEGLIHITCSFSNRKYSIHLEDTTAAFNPITYLIPEENDLPHGRGIKLIRAVTNELQYTRTDTGNRFTLIHYAPLYTN